MIILFQLFCMFSGTSDVIREGLTSPWIPNGWGWGGLASDHCPMWAEFYTDADFDRSDSQPVSIKDFQCALKMGVGVGAELWQDMSANSSQRPLLQERWLVGCDKEADWSRNWYVKDIQCVQKKCIGVDAEHLEDISVNSPQRPL